MTAKRRQKGEFSSKTLEKLSSTENGSPRKARLLRFTQRTALLALAVILFPLVVLLSAVKHDDRRDSTNSIDSSVEIDDHNYPVQSVCLDDGCIEDVGIPLARSFPETMSNWCVRAWYPLWFRSFTSKNRDYREGLMFVKIQKAASSTLAGVVLGLLDRYQCAKGQWVHRLGPTYAHRDLERSFLFTSVRDPAARLISYLNFRLSVDDHIPTEDWVLDKLRTYSDAKYGAISNGQGGYALQFASLHKIPKFAAWTPQNVTKVRNPDQIHNNVRQLLEDYDFCVVVERLDESLVALALILGIDVGDVLVASSKVAGHSYWYRKNHHPQCARLTNRINVTGEIQRFLQSDEWKAMNYGDYVLHAAAEHSLDQTIESLGQDRFDNAMAEYLKLKSLVANKCASKIKFRCTSDGKPEYGHDCYHRDFGCGHTCIHKVVDDFRR